MAPNTSTLVSYVINILLLDTIKSPMNPSRGSLYVNPSDEVLKLLVEKNIHHFEEYAERRVVMVEHDAPCFLHPSWTSFYEKAFMWIGGCRTTLWSSLIFSVWRTYLNVDEHGELVGFLDTKQGNLAQMSGEQFHMINTMRNDTIRQEDKLSCRLATIQEGIADMRMGQEVVEINEEVISVIEAQNRALGDIVKEADKLRVNALKSSMKLSCLHRVLSSSPRRRSFTSRCTRGG